MEFQTFHKIFFNAKCGAYSRVTDREHFDSQITLTDIEAEIVIKHFGHDSIHIGNVESNHEKSLKEFLLYDIVNSTYKPIYLNLVFPKARKTELRLYIAKGRGYKPKGGDIWFIFKDQSDNLVIGSLEEKIWNTLGQADNDDEIYQAVIEDSESLKKTSDVSPEGKIVQLNINGRLVYQRNPKIAIMRFFESDFKCEINPSHETFLSQKSNFPFMEAHHFIPMKYQNIYKTPLDNLNNIITLCPNCHRAMHHAVADYKYELVNKIYLLRPILHCYSLDDIAQYYNCLKIIQN